ncbi:MAG TPA: hypothetical protein VD883_01510 [Candidatus Omnitrophota bacterium]|nr:hypothetical protein [Candidatus Omnitrophota bacterium]
MKKTAAAGLIAVLAAAAFVAHLPLKGKYVDAYFSKKLSVSLSVRVTGAVVVLRRWGQITFESIEIGKEAGDPWIIANDGSLKWTGDRRALAAKTARLSPSVLKEAPFVGSILIGEDEEPRSIRNLKIFWYRSVSGSTVRISDLESDDFRLKGGLRLDMNDRPVKFHALLLVAPDLWRKLPEDLSKRFLKRSDDFRGLRFTWIDRFIRVDGASGPILVAGWQNPS